MCIDRPAHSRAARSEARPGPSHPQQAVPLRVYLHPIHKARLPRAARWVSQRGVWPSGSTEEGCICGMGSQRGAGVHISSAACGRLLMLFLVGPCRWHCRLTRGSIVLEQTQNIPSALLLGEAVVHAGAVLGLVARALAPLTSQKRRTMGSRCSLASSQWKQPTMTR